MRILRCLSQSMSSRVRARSSRHQFHSSQLHQAHTRPPENIGDGEDSLNSEHSVSNKDHLHDESEEASSHLVASIGIHDEAFSKEDALLNVQFFPSGAITTGDRVRIVALNTDSPTNGFKHPKDGYHSARNSRRSSGREYI